LFIGGGQSPDIAIVTTATGRVEKRLKAPAGIECLDASPDGTRLYVAASGTISVMPVDGGAPQVVLKANSFAVDPESGDLIVKLHDQGRIRLARRPAAGGELAPLAVKGDLAFIDEPLMAGSIRNGRLLAPVATRDSWFYFAAVLDLKTSQLARLPLNRETDVHFLSWTPDGRVLATVVDVRSSLWKYSQVAAK
jgi:hypothetical protein